MEKIIIARVEGNKILFNKDQEEEKKKVTDYCQKLGQFIKITLKNQPKDYLRQLRYYWILVHYYCVQEFDSSMWNKDTIEFVHRLFMKNLNPKSKVVIPPKEGLEQIEVIGSLSDILYDAGAMQVLLNAIIDKFFHDNDYLHADTEMFNTAKMAFNSDKEAKLHAYKELKGYMTDKKMPFDEEKLAEFLNVNKE